MNVYLLILIASTTINGKLTYAPEAIVFKTAEQCIKNVDNVKKQLEKANYEVHVTSCVERPINDTE